MSWQLNSNNTDNKIWWRWLLLPPWIWRGYYIHKHTYLMDHCGCQSIHHSNPDLIWLDTGTVRHSFRTHAVYSPHLASSEAHNIQVKDRLKCALDFFFWKSLEGERKRCWDHKALMYVQIWKLFLYWCLCSRPNISPFPSFKLHTKQCRVSNLACI